MHMKKSIKISVDRWFFLFNALNLYLYQKNRKALTMVGGAM